MTTKILSLLACCSVPFVVAAATPLNQAKFSQVIKDVNVVSMETRASSKAAVGGAFNAPDVIRTGADSLAELIAPDNTVTRVGANTSFSFEKSGRAINLEQGSVLFHSPKGKGGGTVKTKGASAAVLGTTIVVTATVGGGFKAIVLEGKGQITLPNGSFRILTAGQVTFVLPGSQRFGPQLNINLQKLVENSRLVQGFEQELPSKPVIQTAIERQVALIVAGVAEDTRILVGNQATEETVTVVDSTVIEQAVETRETRLDIAKRTDVTITCSDLTTYPANLFLDRVPFDIPILGSLNFSGLVGRTITIAPTVSLLDFTLTPFLSQTDFTIGATERLDIQSTMLSICGSHLGMLQDVRLAGRAGLSIASGATISAFDVGNLHFLTSGEMTLNSVCFVNSSGQLHLNAGVKLDLTGGTISSTPSTLLEGAIVSLNGGSYSVTGDAKVSAYGGALNATGTTLSGNNVSLEANTSSDLHTLSVSATTLLNLNSQQDVKVAAGSYQASGGGATLQVSAGRDLTVDGTAQFQGNSVQMNASRNATLSSTPFNEVNIRGFSTLDVRASQNLTVNNNIFTGNAVGSTARLTAGELLSVSSLAIASVANISFSARTVDLANVTFPVGSVVNLYSQFGLLAANPNTGAASVPGYVNFISNVKYGSSPAELLTPAINAANAKVFINVRP